MNKKSHDGIENLIFGDGYKPESKTSIRDLAELLALKLQIGDEEGLALSRYLIENRDEEMIVPDVET
jgi:hypothetical protein